MQAILDFDCTLSEAMVYDNLGGGSLERARQMRLPWWLKQFGGRARLQMLEDFLGRLEGLDVSVHLCSHNNTEVIKEALRRVNLARFFVDTSGRFRIIGSPGVDKAMRIQRHLEQTQSRAEEVMFVDDAAENCRVVFNAIPGLRVHNCNSATGLTSRDCQLILIFFSKLSQTRGQSACRQAWQSRLEGRHAEAKSEDHISSKEQAPGSSPVASPRGTTFRRVFSSSQCEEQVATAHGPSRRSFGTSSVQASSPRARMLSAPNTRVRPATTEPSLSASVRCLSKVRTSVGAQRSLSPSAGQGFAVHHPSLQHSSLPPRKEFLKATVAKASSLPSDSKAFVQMRSDHHGIPMSAPPGHCARKMAGSPPPSARAKRTGNQRLGGS